jgi:lysophospholipase L1-like esterase
MQACLRLFLLGLAIVAAAPVGRAEPPDVVRESIEWCNIWIPDADGTKLPRVLLIGDSITQGYYPRVAELLQGKASVARLTTSKSLGDPVLLAEIELVVKQYPFAVIHFNNGLHGFGYSEEIYRKDFPVLLDVFKRHANDAKLIWAASTPIRVAGNLDTLAPDTQRVVRRNEIAREIVSKSGIAIDDLFGLVKDHPEYHGGDGVHFNEKGIAAEAEQVSRMILERLK